MGFYEDVKKMRENGRTYVKAVKPKAVKAPKPTVSEVEKPVEKAVKKHDKRNGEKS